MLVFIILGLIFIALVCQLIFAEEDFWKTGGLVMGILTLIITIILISNLPWKRDVEYDKARYEELKREVLQVSRMSAEKECDLTILAKKDLFKDVRIMNNYIDKNKTYCDSWWVGWFYSKEIGNLEKIDYYIIE